MWKPHVPDSGKPLYLAIADALERDVEQGVLKPGARLPPQRELAAALDLNLSTVTRAFKECGRRGLISATVGRGTFVSADTGVSVPIMPRETAGPGLIEMGLVLPLYGLESGIVEAIRGAASSRGLGRLLRYTEPSGLPEHREAGALWVARRGLTASPDDILVTSGSQNALSCCLMALFRAGDRVATDALTYPGMKTLAAMLGIRLVPVPMDREGMIPDGLEAACRREPIRGVYLMPEVHNPTTVCLAPHRRERIAALVKRHGLVLIEDDTYGFTGDESRRALSALLPDHAIFLAGVSKALGAGLRISFMAAPKRFRSRLENAVLSTVWMASPLNAEIVRRIVSGDRAQAIVSGKRKEARRRTALALGKLSAYGVWSRPEGYFFWLPLADGGTGRELELAAREEGVRIYRAEKFAVGGGAPQAVRVSLTGADTLPRLAQGLDVIASILAGGLKERQALL